MILDTIERRRVERPVVLFDLDGTLYDNRPRTVRILHAFAASLPHENLADARAILSLAPGDLSYRLDETLAPRGVSPDVINGAQAVWFKRFFTDTACADDVPHRGAAAFARACHQRGATVVYLTGRDIPGMLVGSVRTLRDDGFPIGLPRVELVFKPTFEEPDTEFKRRMLHTFSELGVVVATFENEPGNANLFQDTYPSAVNVLIDTQHAPGAPPLDPACVVLKDFEMP